MLEEYAVVRLKHTVTTLPIQPGTEGTVLIVYSSTPQAYEVEFVDDAGRSLGTYTIEEANLEEVKDA